jgi:radial spoke head protein 4A
LDKGSDTWKIGIVGEHNEGRTVGKDTKPINIGVVFLKNLLWPGWTTVHQLGKTTSIYVGYGFKAGQFYYPC